MARYSKEDILRMVEENEVDFIRLQFTDIFGILKNIAIPKTQLEKALEDANVGSLSQADRNSLAIAKEQYGGNMDYEELTKEYAKLLDSGKYPILITSACPVATILPSF